MSLSEKPRLSMANLVKRWNVYAEKDPMWIILTDPDKRGNKWTEEEFFATGRQEIAGFMQHIQEAGVTLSPEKVLDFGCGVGRLTQALMQHFDAAVGVDISEQMVELAGRYNKAGAACNYVVNTRDDLSQFESGQFSCVFTLIVLQHLHPDFARAYIREFVRILKPGGTLYFQLPAHRVGDTQGGGETDPSSAPQAASFKKRLGKMYYALRENGIECLARLRMALRFSRGEMDVEMHGIPHDAVKQLLEQSGCRVAKTWLDPDSANGWVSYRYCAVKQMTNE